MKTQAHLLLIAQTGFQTVDQLLQIVGRHVKNMKEKGIEKLRRSFLETED